ncbi:MAG TPA: histidinol-phosphatase [Rectinemataceae bacterium]
MRFSFHTHSDFCDGHAKAAEMAAAAAREGYSILGFSSHAPLPFKTDWTMAREDLGPYMEELGRLKSFYAGSGLTILAGLEIDFIAGLVSPADAFFRTLDFDFTIGSVHYISSLPGGSFTVDEPAEDFEKDLVKATGGDARPLWKEYYRSLIAMMDSGGFDILGHFDLVKKNNSGGRWFDEEDKAYLDAAFQAADRAGELGLVAELNTGGIARGKTLSTYPSLPILRRMREAKVRLTIGDDAHSPKHLGAYQELAVDVARAAGYENLWYLDGKGIWKELGI